MLVEISAEVDDGSTEALIKRQRDLYAQPQSTLSSNSPRASQSCVRKIQRFSSCCQRCMTGQRSYSVLWKNDTDILESSVGFSFFRRNSLRLLLLKDK